MHVTHVSKISSKASALSTARAPAAKAWALSMVLCHTAFPSPTQMCWGTGFLTSLGQIAFKQLGSSADCWTDSVQPKSQNGFGQKDCCGTKLTSERNYKKDGTRAAEAPKKVHKIKQDQSGQSKTTARTCRCSLGVL